VSRADGSHVKDLQRGALIAAGVDAWHFYEDAPSRKRDDRPGLASCLTALSSATGFDTSAWLPGEVMAKFFQAP